MNDLMIFAVYSGLLVVVMLIAEFAYKVFKLNTEWTRKIAHIGSGIIALSYPSFIDSHWVVLGLTLSFTVILYSSKKMGLFQSIFSVGRKSYGELFFVWSTWLLFMLYQFTGDVNFYYLGFSSVVFADPAAALIGKAFPLKKYTVFGNTKSFGGSISFFVVSFALSYYFFNVTHQIGSVVAIPNQMFSFVDSFSKVILYSLVHAFLLTIVEAISSKGTDNLTIPIASVLFIYAISLI